MNTRYLEVSYRKGKPYAAYLYLDRKPGDTTSHTQRFEPDMVADITKEGRVMGLEIIAPSIITLEAVNLALAALNHAPATEDELKPLLPREAVASR